MFQERCERVREGRKEETLIECAGCEFVLRCPVLGMCVANIWLNLNESVQCREGFPHMNTENTPTDGKAGTRLEHWLQIQNTCVTVALLLSLYSGFKMRKREGKTDENKD